MNDYQTNYLTERELSQIYKEDYIPMTKQLAEELQLDAWLWFQQYMPSMSESELCVICLRILGCNMPIKYSVRKPDKNSEKNNSEKLFGMTDDELINFYLKERERSINIET